MSWKFWKRENPIDPQQLLAQAHEQMPAPSRPHWQQDPAAGGGFRMVVEDVFAITGRGTVATGRVAAGRLEVGQPVTITRNDQVLGTTVVTGVEQFRKTVEVAQAGENVGLMLSDLTLSGLLLSGVQRDHVAVGDVLTA